jgi:L-ribulose-5-phosphate 3-epimerase
MTRIFIWIAMIAAAAAAVAAPARAGVQVRLGICDWTIGKTGDPAALALAGSLGLEGVQASLVPKGDSLALVDPALRRAYLEAAQRTGVAIASFAIGDLNGVPLKNDPRAEKWLAEAIDIAAAMKVKIILVPFFGNGDLKGDAAGVDAVIAALKRLAPKAEAKGITLAIENTLTAGDNIKILEKVGSPAVRVYYDVANSHDAGYPILDEIRALQGRVVEIHAKDTKDLYGKGSIDFPAVRKAMDDIGFSGWLVMEGTKMPLGVEASVRYDADYLRMIFGGMGTSVAEPSGGSASVVVLAGKDLPPPKLVKHVPPEYPVSALRSDVQGTVIVSVLLGLDGRVSGTRILKSIPALDAAALAAVDKWIYELFLCEGEPRPYALTVTVNFSKGERRSAPKLEPPTVIRQVLPDYPDDAKAKNTEGIVLLGIFINDRGEVTDVGLLRSVPDLDQAAVNAVKEWQYAPATYNGRPIPYSATVSLKFSLDAAN